MKRWPGWDWAWPNPGLATACPVMVSTWIVHWELYCNEPKDRIQKGSQRMYRADELRGFWLIRPDGSLSHAARYLKALLDHAGDRLPEAQHRRN
ncbi:MAG: hypothetical protein ACOY3P_23650 [Planctomycetota bacterium]